MRILHVAECIGGVDRYLRCLLKYSTCENIMIFSQLYKIEDYEKLAEHVEIMHMTHGIDCTVFKEAVELRKKIKKYVPDIVYKFHRGCQIKFIGYVEQQYITKSVGGQPRAVRASHRTD